MSSQRIQQINELIKREMSKIFLREIDPPEDSLITITNVETSADLMQAKIWISIFPINQAKIVFREFSKRVGYLQKLLNKSLFLKFVPKVKFLLDETEEEASQVEKALDEVKN